MATSQFTIFVNTDTVIEVKNLRNTITGALITGATVTARVLDSSDVAVTGVGDPLTLTEVPGNEGLYRATIPDTAAIVEGDTGTIVITADGGAGLSGEWTLDWVAVLRNS